MSQTHLTDIRFDQFDLDPRILAGLADAGFTYCTPIQAEALPLALAGQDVAGQAQTGTGKTAAFLVAAMQRLLSRPRAAGSVAEPPAAGAEQPAAGGAQQPVAGGAQQPVAGGDNEQAGSADDGGERHRRGQSQPRVVILAPTRELAVQIHKDAEVIGRHCGFRLGLVYGGTGYQRQRDEVAAGVDILIGTPGRLIDYFKQRVFNFKAVEVVVLDEADRMFDLGFIKDIRFVLRRMPPPTSRLGMLFSATLSYRVTELAYEHMNDPKMVEIAPEQVTAERVRQRCFMVGNDEKVPLLIGLLRQLPDARAMVFINTKREGERVWGYLQGNGLQAAMLSGDVPQKKRLSLLRRFQAGELPIMVATDVAARGLHIPGVTHVINYDLPEDAEDYVHRIGRTARAGEAGDAISFVCETYAFCLPDIEAYIGAKIEVSPMQDAMLAEVDPRSRVRVPRRPRDERGGRGDERRGSARPRGRNRGAAGPRQGRSDAPAAQGDAASAETPPRRQAPAGAGAEDAAAGGESAAPKPRRRRRRRRPAAAGDAPVE